MYNFQHRKYKKYSENDKKKNSNTPDYMDLLYICTSLQFRKESVH